MQCPVDNAVLVMSERNGIEIDYCPTCRGVWLDRGELDKILERAASPAPASYQQSQQQPQQQYQQPQSYQQRPQQYQHKKKSSWLSELFD